MAVQIVFGIFRILLSTIPPGQIPPVYLQIWGTAAKLDGCALRVSKAEGAVAVFLVISFCDEVLGFFFLSLGWDVILHSAGLVGRGETRRWLRWPVAQPSS